MLAVALQAAADTAPETTFAELGSTIGGGAAAFRRVDAQHQANGLSCSLFFFFDFLGCSFGMGQHVVLFPFEKAWAEVPSPLIGPH